MGHSKKLLTIYKLGMGVGWGMLELAILVRRLPGDFGGVPQLGEVSLRRGAWNFEVTH